MANYYVPKVPSTKDAKTSLTEARAAVRAAAARVTRQQKAASPGVHASVVSAASAQRSATSPLLPLPFETIDATQLTTRFVPLSPRQALSSAFTSTFAAPTGAIVSGRGVSFIEGVEPPSAAHGVVGTWLYYKDILGKPLYLQGGEGFKQKSDGSFDKVTLSSPIIARRALSDRGNTYAEFDLSSALPVYVPPEEIDGSAIVEGAKLVPLYSRGKYMPFGKSFGALRPAGTARDAKPSYALVTPSGDQVPASAFAPGVDGPIILGVAAEARRDIGVPARAYDVRLGPDGLGERVDPGPFGAARGLIGSIPYLPDGQGRRPQGAVYDDRFGGYLAVYPEEAVDSIALRPPWAEKKAGVLSLRSRGVEISSLIKHLCARSAYDAVLEAVQAEVGDPNDTRYANARVFAEFAFTLALFDAKAAQTLGASTTFEPSGLDARLTSTKTARSWSLDTVRSRLRQKYNRESVIASGWDTPVVDWLLSSSEVDPTRILAGDVSYPAAIPSFECAPHEFKGNTPQRRDRVSLIVLHWGSFRTLTALDSARTSTHFTITPAGKVTQVLDLRKVAYHASDINGISIGVDLDTPSVKRPLNASERAWVRDEGFTEIDASRRFGFTNSNHKLYVAPVAAYEACYQLVSVLRGLTDPLLDSSALVYRNTALHVLEDRSTVEVVMLSPGVIYDQQGPYRLQGYAAHRHAQNSDGHKSDGLDMFFYCTLRDKGQPSATAYTNMKQMFSADVLTTPFGPAVQVPT